MRVTFLKRIKLKISSQAKTVEELGSASDLSTSESLENSVGSGDVGSEGEDVGSEGEDEE